MPKPAPDQALQAMDTQENEKPTMGRPTVVTVAAQLEICARIAEGESLNKTCSDPSLPSMSSVLRALHGGSAEFSDFRSRYAIARDALLDCYADEMVDIADDGTTDYVIKTGRNGHEYEAVDQEHIQRSRLRVHAREWILSKLRPEQYGDKVINEATGTMTVKHDITSLTEREKMRRFALFMVEDQRQPFIEGELASGTKSQSLESHVMSSPQATDCIEPETDDSSPP